jgi:uncharacterized Tic20 family protein
MEDDAAFCPNCGTNVSGENQAPNPPVDNNAPEFGGQNPGFDQGYNQGYQQGYNNQGYGAPNGGQNPPPYYGAPGGDPYYGYQPQPSPTDHTAEFEARDISENKVLAMAPYLLGVLGIIVALLAMHDSKYVAFHVRQALKLTITATLVGIVTLLLGWTVIVAIAGGICEIIIIVLKIIAFFQVCCGKAKEPAIISSLGFLK